MKHRVYALCAMSRVFHRVNCCTVCSF